MLSPETLFFEVKNQATEKRQIWKNVNNGDTANNFKFNVGAMTSMRVFLPDHSSVPSQLKLALATDTQFYHVNSPPGLLSKLIFSKDFVNIFLTQGRLWIQSVIKEEEYFILNSGKLWMFLNKPAIERLEFTGASVFDINDYLALVELDLQRMFKSDICAKTLLKCRESLSRIEHLFEQPLKLSWQPYAKETCPSSIAKFFHDNGAKIDVVDAFINSRQIKSQTIPLVDLDLEHLDATEIDFETCEEWMGALLFNISGETTKNDHFVSLVEAEGMFQLQDLHWSIDAVRDTMKGWALISITPSAAANVLKQHSNMKLKQFSFASTTLLVTENSIFARSKRGSL